MAEARGVISGYIWMQCTSSKTQLLH